MSKAKSRRPWNMNTGVVTFASRERLERASAHARSAPSFVLAIASARIASTEGSKRFSGTELRNW